MLLFCKFGVLSYGYPMDILRLSYGEGPILTRKRLGNDS